MSSGQQVPPWLREEISKFQQAQQSMQSVAAQIQHFEAEQAESARAAEELAKAGEGDAVYRSVGALMVQTGKKAAEDYLAEARTLRETRLSVLKKQEERLRAELKAQEEKINQAIRGGGAAPPGGAPKQ